MRIKQYGKSLRITLLCLISLLMLLLSFTVMAADDGNSREEEFLNALGIMTENDGGNTAGDDVLTRAQLAKILTVLDGNMPKGLESKQIFPDVTEDAWYYDYVALAYNYGYLSGYEDGLFRPDKAVTANEAAIALIKVAGYYNYSAVKYASSDSPMFKAAGDVGIFKGVYLEKDDIVNRSEMAKMVYNTLFIPSMEFVSVSGEGEDWRINKEKKVLEYRMNIIEVKDRLNSVGAMSVLDTNAVLPSDRVVIGETECGNESSVLLTDYIGYQGVFYVREEDDEYYLVHADFSKTKSEVEIVDAKDIIKADLKEIRYEQEGGASRSIRLSDDITVVYNGRVLESYDGSEFKPTYGKIKLIDDEYLIIYDITTYVVDRFDITNNIIYDKYGNGGISFPEDEAHSYFWASGKKTGNPVYNAGYNDVIDVMKSSDGAAVTVIMSNDTIKGTVTGMTEDSIVIDGQNVDLAESFLKIYTDDKKTQRLYEKILIGMEIEFYLNSSGEIAGCDIEYSAGYSYGYLMKVLTDELGEYIILKLFTEDGIVARYETKEEIKYNEEYKVSAVDDVYYALKDNPQLIKYKLNKDNKIVDIKTAVDNTNGEERFIEDKFSVDFKSGGYVTRVFGMGVGCNYSILNTSKVFIIPEDVNKEKLFTAGNGTLLSGDIKDLNLNLYDTDEAGIPTVVVRFISTSGSGTVNVTALRDNLMVIKSVKKVYIEEEGEVGLELQGFMNGAEKSFVCTDLELKNASEKNPWNTKYSNIYAGTKITDLKCGDFIFVSTDVTGMINGFVVALSPHKLPAKYTEVMSAGGTATYNNNLDVVSTHYGKVIKRYKTAILVNAHDDAKDKLWNKTFAMKGVYVYLYDSKAVGNKVSVITTDEIRQGDIVIVKKNYNQTKDVYIIR